MTLAEGDAAARAEARERELWDAFVARDVAAIERLVDPLALDVGPGGVLTRDEVVAAVAAMEISSYEIDGLRARPLGGVEVVVYRSRVDGTYRGAPFPAPVVLCTSVWRERGGAWTLVHRHESVWTAR